MTLTLAMLRCPDAVPPQTRRVTGGEFSLGRGPDADWVLPDPDRHVSKRHCVLGFRQGGWQIADLSSNGTFLNHDREPLGSGKPRPLADGDRIRLGPYEIEVRLDEKPVGAGSARGFATAADPFGDDPFAERSDFAASVSTAAPDEFDLLAPGAGLEADFIGPTHADHSPAVTDALYLATPRPPPPQDDWDLDFSTPAPAASKVAAAPAEAKAEIAGADLLAAFLRGAGMQDAAPADPARTMERLGAAFRAMVSGLGEAMRARREVKSEFRIEQTMIRRAGNNPLKFAAGDDDALAALLGTGRRSDMSPADAVAEALADIRLHELATMAAMQAAMRAVVARLSPDSVRRATDQAGGMASLPVLRRARAWEAFEALHAEVSRGLSDDFDSVFGKTFARAYEQYIADMAGRDRRG